MIKHLVLGLFCVFGVTAYAQVSYSGNGPLEQSSKARIERKLTDSTEKGYRVQVLMTNKRQEALEAKQKLESTYPFCPVYLIYDAPNFKLRIGDFVSKTEALSSYFSMKSEYTAAFVLEDRINPIVFQACTAP